MDGLKMSVQRKKATLNDLRSKMVVGGLSSLTAAHRVDLIYSSNALEGNTLTSGETALVLEKGITVGGKSLRDHMEVVDLARALDWAVEFAERSPKEPFTQNDIRNLHYLVVQNSKPGIAGRYADEARFVNTDDGPRYFAAPVEVPALMEEFTDWLNSSDVGMPERAFDAHTRFVNIHPFNDGNGRTGRLLMNLVLVQDGYPPISVRPSERPKYLAALQESGKGDGSNAAINDMLFERIDETLDMFIGAARQAAANPVSLKAVGSSPAP